jgi:hypothetical protein
MKQTSVMMIIDNKPGNEQHYTPESGICATDRQSKGSRNAHPQPGKTPVTQDSQSQSESPAHGGASKK